MATVVRGFPDTRASSLGKAVGGFLTKLQDNRIDKLQQELMDEISNSKDEASAAALFADPRFKDVVNDTQRFAVTMKFLESAQPGQTSLQGFTEDGEMVLFSVPQGTPIDNALFSDRGLHPERERGFYLKGDKEEEIPELIGSFRSKGQALKGLEDEGLDISGLENRILNQAEAGFEAQFATTRANQRRAEIDSLLRQDRFSFDKQKGATVFSNLVHERSSGNLTQGQFEEAWKKATTIYGRTATDMAEDSLPDLTEQAAMVENASRLAKILVDKAIQDPRLITRASGLASFGSDVVAEFEAVIGLVGGRPDKNIEDFDWGSLTGERAEFKGMLFDMAIIAAAARGISGRNFSDRDLQLFLTRVGSDVHNVVAFAQNMRGLTNSLQADFQTSYSRLQDEPYTKGFTRIILDKKERDEALDKHYEGLGFDVKPKSNPVEEFDVEQ
jgi:hypothetical protein